MTFSFSMVVLVKLDHPRKKEVSSFIYHKTFYGTETESNEILGNKRVELRSEL